MIRKGIAAGLPDVGVYPLGQIAALKCRNAFIGAIDVIDNGSDLGFGGCSAQPIVDEELCAEAVVQVGRVIALHDCADRIVAGEIPDDIESIHISQEIQNAKGMGVGIVIEEILVVVGPDFLGHLLHRAGDTAVLRELQQIANIAGPAAKIGSVLIAGMIGHIQAAEHVGKLHLIPVGNGKAFQIAESADAGPLLLVTGRHKCGKCRLFFSAEGVPGAGIVLFHTAANIVDNQTHRILAAVFLGKCIGTLLQKLQAGHEVRIAVDGRQLLRRFFPRLFWVLRGKLRLIGRQFRLFSRFLWEQGLLLRFLGIHRRSFFLRDFGRFVRIGCRFRFFLAGFRIGVQRLLCFIKRLGFFIHRIGQFIHDNRGSFRRFGILRIDHRRNAAD